MYELTAQELEEPQYRASAPVLYPRGDEFEREHGRVIIHNPQYSDHKEQEVEHFDAKDFEAEFHNQRRK